MYKGCDVYDDSDCSSSSSWSLHNFSDIDERRSGQMNTGASDLLARCVIHLDIDYFYCQCEEILNPSLSTKPLAIGQKHIIVTSNYVARRLGVKKLMRKNEAQRICPSLEIIDGSDLEKYRAASREVYEAFRYAVKNLNIENIAKKGCMDEMIGDVTVAVEKILTGRKQTESESKIPSKVFVYGEDLTSSTITLSEDQSGAEATISHNQIYSNDNASNINDKWGNSVDKLQCKKKLKIAATLAYQIQEYIRSKTKYSTSIGVSVSPFLAKITSDLKKPNGISILYPWRASTIIDNMPLRKIPDLGSRTLRALLPCLEQYNKCTRRQNEEFWTCR